MKIRFQRIIPIYFDADTDKVKMINPWLQEKKSVMESQSIPSSESHVSSTNFSATKNFMVKAELS